MITRIGIVAGEIWEYLDKGEGSVSLEETVKGVDQTRDAVLMSIGWLAREGHVVIKETPDGNMVKLVGEGRR
ncbi:MAG: winged helix-turn-helix domain-containing protein [Candidatus Aadella gelida]|nr:winged helix-turn-helix domain-containing protein [Candidatus Aadella gelida]